ncbi:solute carrier family 2, facilitated glucose transporter member 1-like [Mercenaria mercenaria]|uniref:solute carrier family 2, facilitated glucose transporter member 1-like n=1 Tax=Mercenaria mercenaria TaxID=6596 RepID=UPI00234EAEAC|nr:solute carrier family 2, facilitated glucose transporter member 1-like [Mercenaria mercenaria]
MGESESGPVMTWWLFLSITISVFGNSFLYGYNIGVVNSPARMIKAFYKMTYLARDGVKTYYNSEDRNLYFTSLPESYANNFTVTTTVEPLGVAEPEAEPFGGSNDTSGGNGTLGVARDPFLAFTEEEIEADNVIEILWSITVAFFVFFGMIGAFSSGRIADYFGRKKGMVLITFLMFLAGIFGGIPTVAKSPECVMVSRIFVGLHTGMGISLASLYLAEISPKKIRGAVGTCHQLFVTMGILWSMVLGLPTLAGTWATWPALFAFNAGPSLVCLLFMPLCPESPRYLLIKKNDEEGARKALRKLRGSGYSRIEDEIEEMKIEARKASSVETFTMKKLLVTPELKLPLIIAIVVQIAQQWSGINAAMAYSSFIYTQANVPDSVIPYVVVGQGAVNVISTIVSVPLMEKLGRRPLLIWPLCGMIASFIALTVCLNLLQDDAYAEQKNVLAIISIIAMLTFVIGFALGLGPIPYTIVSEIFRQEPRAAAMSLSMAIQWTCNFILLLTFRFIQKSIGAYTYLIFIVIMVASFIFLFIYVPETKNRTFDEIARAIASGKEKKRRDYSEDEEEMQPMGRQSD